MGCRTALLSSTLTCSCVLSFLLSSIVGAWTGTLLSDGRFNTCPGRRAHNQVYIPSAIAQAFSRANKRVRSLLLSFCCFGKANQSFQSCPFGMHIIMRYIPVSLYSLRITSVALSLSLRFTVLFPSIFLFFSYRVPPHPAGSRIWFISQSLIIGETTQISREVLGLVRNLMTVDTVHTKLGKPC